MSSKKSLPPGAVRATPWPCSNGTLVLDVALKALGVGPGDEVVVTPRTFIASISCVVNAGATPVFADVEADSGNI